MSGIKYYQLAKDETPPDEFCAVRDIGGEPSEYMFYVPEAENAKLRELVRDMFMTFCTFRETAMTDREELEHSARFWKRLDELGIEVDE